MANRVSVAIARMEKQIAGRIASGQTTAEGVDRAHRALDMTLPEFARFQTLKSVAVLNGHLTEDEGQVVYALLGETPSVFNDQPAHIKYVLNSLFKELLRASIRERSVRAACRPH